MIDPSRSAIIEAKPIGHGLDAFRESAESVFQELDVSSLPMVLSRITREDHALDLISALQILPVSRVAIRLSKLNLTINTEHFDVAHVISLLTVVLNKKSDILIWDEVYKVVADVVPVTVAEPSTPPPSDPPHTAPFRQTPWTFTTGSFTDTSDLRRDVDPILKNKVEGNLRVDYPNVFNTFFGGVPRLHEMTTAVLQSSKDATPPLFQEDIGWVGWPDSCEETAVLQFLRATLVASMGHDALEDIAGEEIKTKSERIRLEKEISLLEKGKTIIG